MTLHPSFKVGCRRNDWRGRSGTAFDRAADEFQSGGAVAVNWSAGARMAIFMVAALGSWAVVLGTAYLLVQAF